MENSIFLHEGDSLILAKDVAVEGNKITALCEGAKVEIYDELHFSTILIFRDGKWVSGEL